jgi:murein L,D-transpeptidase YcbB/YkuD
MNSGEQKFVKLNNPVPVFITYYTAWVDEDGRLNFREDIYSHDQQLRAKMFGRKANRQLATSNRQIALKNLIRNNRS